MRRRRRVKNGRKKHNQPSMIQWIVKYQHRSCGIKDGTSGWILTDVFDIDDVTTEKKQSPTRSTTAVRANEIYRWLYG